MKEALRIWGIRLDTCTKEEALERIPSFLREQKPQSIFTPNPEMLVDAKRDQYFKEALNSGALNICDGRGLELFFPKKLHRIPGTDFVLDICKEARKSGSSVYLLGSNSDEVVSKAASNLCSLFPGLRIAGIHPGIPIKQKEKDGKMILFFDSEKHDVLMRHLADSKPDILFVAFGHGKQEKWIYEYAKQIPDLKIAMGVGGALDYISGIKKRAPILMRRWGLEWLWRLIREPWRIGRIWKASILFPLAYILDRFKGNKAR